MSDETVDRADQIEPEAEDAVLAKPLADYLECVERLKDIFPGKEHEDALEASIKGCVEVITRGGAYTTPVGIDAPPPPPPFFSRRPATGATPRRKTKHVLTPAQRCHLAERHYDHVYGLWVELGKPPSGPLYNDVLAAYRAMDHWCYGAGWGGAAPDIEV